MATKRPAKLASKKKAINQKLCPITNKPMVPAKFVRAKGGSGMFWVVAEEFNGDAKSLDRIIPTH